MAVEIIFSCCVCLAFAVLVFLLAKMNSLSRRIKLILNKGEAESWAEQNGKFWEQANLDVPGDVIVSREELRAFVALMQSERAAKEKLQEELNLIFAYQELKYPKQIKARLEAHQRQAANSSYQREEDKVIAAALQEVLQRIDPDWLEDNIY